MTAPRNTVRSRRAGALLIAALALGAFAAGVPGSGSPDPSRAIEAEGGRFVQAVNSGDDSLRAATVRDVFSEQSIRDKGIPAHVAFMARLAGDFGHLQFHHAEVTTMRVGETVRRSLHVYARSEKDGGWKDFQFQLDPDPPHRIRQLVFIASVAEPVYLPNGPITDPGTVSWLDGYIDRLVRDDDLSGALLVAIGDTPIVERYFGYADSARTVPCTARTRFNLGSGNKMFTALALAGLVEEGKLRFDDTLDRYFPDFPEREWAHQATVGNLLSHTSGLGEYWTDENDRALSRVTSFRDILPMIERAGIDFPPGKGASYSNSNFILAGLIVEAVTGKDYYEVIRDRIYRPAGMTETGSYPLDGSVPDLAEPLIGSPHAWRRAPRHIGRGTPAGGGFSTPRDILAFGRALVGGKIVDRDVLAEMTRSHTAQIPGATLDYGYGFLREASGDGAQSFGHGGIAPGINFEYRYFPASDVTLIVFSNQDNGAYDSLRKTVTRLITGER